MSRGANVTSDAKMQRVPRGKDVPRDRPFADRTERLSGDSGSGPVTRKSSASAGAGPGNNAAPAAAGATGGPPRQSFHNNNSSSSNNNKR